MEPKTGKRIVSKGAYMKAQGKRLAWALIGAITCLIGLIVPLWVVWQRYQLVPAFRNGSYLIGIGFALTALNCLCRLGLRTMKQAKQINPGVPLTRANTADLSAPASLVRASEEPVQAQESVLLRAATERQETSPEQLVRASVGME